MKTQAKIGFGLLLGAVAGGLAAALLPGAGWILWFADNVADPAGQIFLRVLFMTVIPLVFLSVTLGVAGVPPVGIAVILGVDRLLDMGRTALNVVGDLSASLYAERVHSGRPAAIPGAD